MKDNLQSQQIGRSGSPSDLIGTLTAPQVLQRAIAAQNAGRLVEADALCRALLMREPTSLPATHLRAVIAAARDDYGLAVNLLVEVLHREPLHVGALNQLAGMYWTHGRAEKAIGLCREAAGLSPKSAETRDNLGLAYLAAGKYEEAAEAFEQAISLKADWGDACCHLAIARDAQGRTHDAAAALERARSQAHMSAKNSAESFRLIGRILQGLGWFDLAAACFRRAIALQPLWTAPYLDACYGMKFTDVDGPLIAEMHNLLGNPALSDGGRADLHFGLGKALDDLRVFGDAMKHFDEANRLKPISHEFDRARHSKSIDWIIDTFTQEYFAKRPGRASQDKTPVVVFGMPRSGTTLVERTLLSHPQIGSGGELLFWGDAATMLAPQVPTITPAVADRVANEYLAVLKAAAPGALRVIDKMPSNFFRLGLIHAILPNARLVHCRRQPVDTCLSIYFTQFNRGHEYAYDRGSIVSYYEQYLRLMSNWRSVLPADRMIEIDYEDLVSDHEAVSRRLVEFCGLAWNESCLRPATNSGSVNTASVWQVRQPIYSSSKARWRNYESWLGEFRRLLPTSA